MHETRLDTLSTSPLLTAPQLPTLSPHSVTNICDLQPDAIGLDVLVTVLSLNLTVSHQPASGGAPIRACEFTVADHTGSVKLHARGAHADALPRGALVLVRGCHTDVFDGQMHLKLGQWSTFTVAVPAPAAAGAGAGAGVSGAAGSLSASATAAAAAAATGLVPVTADQLPTLPDMSAVRLVPTV